MSGAQSACWEARSAYLSELLAPIGIAVQNFEWPFHRHGSGHVGICGYRTRSKECLAQKKRKLEFHLKEEKKISPNLKDIR